MSHEIAGRRFLNSVHWSNLANECVEGKAVYIVNSAGAITLDSVYLLDGTPVVPIPTSLFEGPCPPSFSDSWGHAMIVGPSSWTSPANMSSVEYVVISGSADVTVNGVTVNVSSGTSGKWGQEDNFVLTKPSGYVQVTPSLGSRVYLAWQTRP